MTNGEENPYMRPYQVHVLVNYPDGTTREYDAEDEFRARGKRHNAKTISKQRVHDYISSAMIWDRDASSYVFTVVPIREAPHAKR